MKTHPAGLSLKWSVMVISVIESVSCCLPCLLLTHDGMARFYTLGAAQFLTVFWISFAHVFTISFLAFVPQFFNLCMVDYTLY